MIDIFFAHRCILLLKSFVFQHKRALFSFKFISYCAYLIIIFIRQRNQSREALSFFLSALSGTENITNGSRRQTWSCFNYCWNEWNERMAIESSIDIKLQIKANLLSQRTAKFDINSKSTTSLFATHIGKFLSSDIGGPTLFQFGY